MNMIKVIPFDWYQIKIYADKKYVLNANNIISVSKTIEKDDSLSYKCWKWLAIAEVNFMWIFQRLFLLFAYLLKSKFIP